MDERTIRFLSRDGVELEGTLSTPPKGQFDRLAILTPGIDVDREEDGGFYTQLAGELASQGAASFRFDWRCHGHDRSRLLTELTLAGLYNDIDAAFDATVGSINQKADVFLIATSFSGGVAANWARRNSDRLAGTILLAPILDYFHEYVTRASLAEFGRHLSVAARANLAKAGYIESWGKRFSQQIVNEFFASEIDLPQRACVIIHGSADEGVDIAVPKSFVSRTPQTQLFVLEGADHGFCEPGDHALNSPKTREFFAVVFREIVSIVSTGKNSGEIPLWPTTSTN